MSTELHSLLDALSPNTQGLADAIRADKLSRYVDHPSVDWAAVLANPEEQDSLDQLANERDEELLADAKAEAEWEEWLEDERGESDSIADLAPSRPR